MLVTIWMCTQEWSLMLEAEHRVHVRHVPPRLELVVGVDPLDQLAELAVGAHRHPDPHPGDRLRGREPGLALGLGGGGQLERLAALRLRGHQASAGTAGAGVPVSARLKYMSVQAAAMNGTAMLCAIRLPIQMPRNGRRIVAKIAPIDPARRSRR